ncbi:hypothetical protein [Streptomyces puniciscabiei]|uniref:hypothetical protein n=1 Tax=Streptomyces puniciscabiei TaxID=164348 RepID=UPI003330B4E1
MTKQEALRNYGAAALAHERLTADGTVESGWSGPADVQSSFVGQRHSAGRNRGGTRQRPRGSPAEREADLIERENEALAQDAARADLLNDVAAAIDYDPDLAPW